MLIHESKRPTFEDTPWPLSLLSFYRLEVAIAYDVVPISLNHIAYPVLGLECRDVDYAR